MKIPIINILSLISCIVALTVLISASIFYDTVKSGQNDPTPNLHKGILKDYDLSYGDRKELQNIYGIKPSREPFFQWTRGQLLHDAICVKYQLTPAYLFYSLASIVLSLIQIGVALWCAFTTTLKLDAKIIESVWISRALMSHLLLYALSLLLFNFMYTYSQHEDGWIEKFKTEIKETARSSKSDYGSLPCNNKGKDIHIIVQIINLVFLGIKLIIIFIFVDFFNFGNWKLKNSQRTRNYGETLSNASSLKSMRSRKGQKGFLPPILDEPEEDMDPDYRKKSV